LSTPFAFSNPIVSGAIFVGIAIIWILPEKKVEEALMEE
jgi:hypothetical protein